MLVERWLEFLLLYGVGPSVFAVVVHRFGYRGAMAPVLWVLSLLLFVALYGDPAFDRACLWRLPLSHPHVRVMVLRFVILGTALLGLGRYFAPERFLWIARTRPLVFLLLAVGYPVLSVIPQGLIWRVFFVQRYAALFTSPLTLVAVGAVAFSLAHLTFRNGVAIFVTAIGGALFLETYIETQSMLLAALEHGVYGVTAFTAGLGKFLYLGRRFDGRRAPGAIFK
jgi:hypothetical protein